MFRLSVLSLLLFLLSACSDDDGVAPIDTGSDDTNEAEDTAEDDSGDDSGDDAGAAAECEVRDPAVVTFDTDDGVTLEAAHFPSGVANGGAVVLLHMIPPSNNRGNYSRTVIDPLQDDCITVLNVDRRGAGGSGGEATDAYEGANGVLDAKAAVEFLLESDNAPARIAIVGASNGTTTMLDYAALEDSPASPVAFVFLSGGTYTENQNTVAAALPRETPALFLYPAGEAAWNDGVAEGAPEAWRFVEYDPGSHGTRLFASNPETVMVVGDFLRGALLAE